MTANVRMDSAQRLGRRATAWSGISFVQTHWLPVILTGRCLDGDAENARNENTRHENAAPKIRGENGKSET